MNLKRGIEEIRQTEIRLLKRATLLSLLPIFISLFLGKYFLAMGVIIGVLIAFLNFHLLAKGLLLSLRSKYGLLFTFGYIFRFFLLAILFVLIIKFNKSSFIGTVIGFLIFQFLIYFERWKMPDSIKL